jgi:hypothetical protein
MNTLEFEKIVESKVPITEIIDLKNRKYITNLNFPGLYVFWFNNHDNAINNLKRNLIIKGPNGIDNNICWDWNLEKSSVCLYVGKSYNLQKRLGLHLLLKTPNLYETQSDYLNKKTTSCQLRSGFDYLLQSKSNIDIVKELSNRIDVSIIKEVDFIKRFYKEDLLIGSLLPWFNVDSER